MPIGPRGDTWGEYFMGADNRSWLLLQLRCSLLNMLRLVVCGLASLGIHSYAATEWKTNGDGNWGAANLNWTNGVPSLTQTARFVQSRIASNININLNGNREAFGLFANQAGQTRIIPGDPAGNTLTIGAGGIEVTQAPNGPAPGRIAIDANVALAASQGWLNNRNGSGSDIQLGPGYTLNLGSHTLTTNGPGDTTIDSTVVGSGSITKRGDGILTLSGNNTFSGGIDVQKGTLRIFNDANLGVGSILLDGATLRIESPTTINNPIQLNTSATNAIRIEGNNVVLTSALSGGGQWEKYGPGTLTLTGPNTNVSYMYVRQGQVRGGAGNLNPRISINSGASLDITSGGTYVGQITGEGTLTKSGSGDLTLSLPGGLSANSPGLGTTITGGILRFNTGTLVNDINVGPGASVVFNNGGTYANKLLGTGNAFKTGSGGLNFTNSAPTHSGPFYVSGGWIEGSVSSLNGAASRSFTLSSGTGLVINDDIGGTFYGAITQSGTGSSRTLTKRGAGRVLLAGANNFNGTISIEGGTLAGNNSTLSQAGSSVSIASGATLELTSSGTINFGHPISGGGRVLKTRGGSLNYSGTATNLGGMEVAEGLLNLTGTLNGNLTVSGTGIVTGTGTINGDFIIEHNANFSLTAFDRPTLNGELINSGYLNVDEAVPQFIGTNFTQTFQGNLSLKMPTTPYRINGTADLGGVLYLESDSLEPYVGYPVLTADAFADSSPFDVIDTINGIGDATVIAVDSVPTLFIFRRSFGAIPGPGDPDGLGDGNGNGFIDEGDVDPLVHALFDPLGYYRFDNGRIIVDLVGKFDIANRGENGGVVDFDDVAEFTARLSASTGSLASAEAMVAAAIDAYAQSKAIPEPSTGTMVLAFLALIGVSVRRPAMALFEVS